MTRLRALTQDNLQQEKRSAQEVDYVLMHRLLSPVQSATLILQARSADRLFITNRVQDVPSTLVISLLKAGRAGWCRHPFSLWNPMTLMATAVAGA